MANIGPYAIMKQINHLRKQIGLRAKASVNSKADENDLKNAGQK